MTELPSPNDSPSRWSLNRWTVIVSLLINGLLILGFALWRISFSASENLPSKPNSVAESFSPAPEAEPEVEPVPGETASETVHRVMEEQIQSAQNRTDEENLRVLEQQGERLNRFSSEESIDQLTPIFHDWTQTEERTTQPAQDAPLQTENTVSTENFDTETAQFHDVKRFKTKSGKIKYKAVLLDAQGRTLLMELPQEDGEKIYQLFKQMKKNPLMEKIYRQLVMPLIDKQLKK